MPDHKITFTGGQQRDWSLDAQPPNTFRDAVNMDLRKRGDLTAVATLSGTEAISDLFDVGTDVNVLAMVRCEAQYDLDADGEYEIDEESLLLLTRDSVNGSVISLVRLSTGVQYTLYDSSDGDDDLAFPAGGTASGFYERQRNIPTYTWADDTNPLRTIQLRYSAAVTGVQTPYRMLWLRPPLFGENPVVSAVTDGGALPCGGYSFMVRWWSREYCRGSAWSLPTNVVPITPEDPLVPPDDYVRGGAVGEGSNRSIILDISETPGAGFKDPWDSLQVLVVPYTDGSKEPPTTGYLLEPREDWYDALQIKVTNIDGLRVTLDDYVVDDAPLIRAKSILAKENYAFAGNVAYQDFKPRPGVAGTRFDGTIRPDRAETIVEALDPDTAYAAELDCVHRRGHFRGEQYAYGISHYDEFGNFGPVQALDLKGFYARARHEDWPAGTEVEVKTTITGSSDGDISWALEISTTTLLTGMSSLVSSGDVFCFQGSDYVWKAISATESGSLTVVTLTTGDTFADFFAALSEVAVGQRFWKGWGQAGNQADNWAWRFCSRADNQFSLFDSDGNIRALGLRLTGVKNHPLWSRGFAVVRQARKRNLLYQGLSVPPIANFAAVTPGANAANDSEVPENGEAINTYAPKLYLLGRARDIVTIDGEEDPSVTGMVLAPSVWIDQQPHTEGHLMSWFQPPGFMANFAGTDQVLIEEQWARKARIIDAVALRRNSILYTPGSENTMSVVTEALDVFTADAGKEYFYSPSGLIYSISPSGAVTTGLLSYFKSPVYLSRVLPTYPATGGRPLEYGVNGLVAFSLGHERQFFGLGPDQRELTSTVNTIFTVIARYHAVRFWGGLRDLTRQQDDNSAIRSLGRFTGLLENQRGILLRIDGFLGEMTWEWVTGLNAGAGNAANAFPSLSSGERPSNQNAISTTYLNTVYLIGASPPNNIPSNTLPADATNTDEHHVAGFIINLERGLGDDRYGEAGEDAVWYPTGAVVPLTPAEVAANTPKTVDVWGGDCFITKYRQKISGGLAIPRSTGTIRDVLADLDAPTEGGGLIDSTTVMLNQWGPKVGTMDAGCQVAEYFVESEVNCNYFSQDDVYPNLGSTEDQKKASMLKSWTYDYNPGYSAEPRYKVLVSVIDQCQDNDGIYPSRIHISDKRVYQGAQQGLVDTLGFDRWRAGSTFDCEEGYGDITALVDNGGGLLHTIQEFGVRYDPINRDIAEVGNDSQLVLGRAPIGRGGKYMPIKDGCQHIRTVVTDNGICYFVSAREGIVLSFGPGTSMWTLSEQGTQSVYAMSDYFRDLLAGKTIAETELDAGFDRDRGEYWVQGRGWGTTDPVTIRFSREINGWIGRFVGPADYPVRRFASAYGGYYALTSNTEQTSALRLWRMHTGAVPGEIFGFVTDSEISVVLNLPDDTQKTFDVIQLQGQGGSDTVDIQVSKPDGTTQVCTAAVFQPAKNGWYRANRLRQDTVRSRLRGTAALATLRFDMSANPQQRIFDAVIYSSRPSAKNF